jgi:hypothetical protein
MIQPDHRRPNKSLQRMAYSLAINNGYKMWNVGGVNDIER